jgi:predicted outer membrane repeat protein
VLQESLVELPLGGNRRRLGEGAKMRARAGDISRATLSVVVALLLLASPSRRALAGGVVGTGTPESCTEAALNAALAAGGSVTFNCGTSPFTLTVTTRKAIAADTSIDGGGLISLSGGGTTQVMMVNQGVSVALVNLAISTASAESSSGMGGAVSNSGALTVTDSTFSNNDAVDGGAIYNAGTLTVTSSAFSGNTVLEIGASARRGGAIYNSGTLTVINSTFSGNTADGGGAIYDTGTLEVTNSTFSGNGYCAIYSYGASTVTNSTLSGNSGAICSTAGVVRNTIVANSDLPLPSGVSCSLVSCACSGNQFIRCGGGPVGDATCALFGAGTCVPVDHGNCSGTITDGGHNLDDGTTCGFSAANGSLTNTDPDLDPAGLASNGGLTQTIALHAGSPAINTGDETVCAATPVNNLDQRRFIRPGVGAANCSIGAYEYGSPGASDCCQCPTSCALPVNGSCGSCILVFGATCESGDLCVLHTPTPTPTITRTPTVTPTPTDTGTSTQTPTSTVTPTPTQTATTTPGPNDCCQCGDFCAPPIVGTCGGCTVVFAASCGGGGLCTSQTPPTQTVIRSATATATLTLVPTTTATPAATATATQTGTPTLAATPTATVTATPTYTCTNMATSTPTTAATATPSDTPTNTPTGTSAETPTQTPTETSTAAPTDTATATPTYTPTGTATSTPTQTFTDTPSTPTSTPTETAVPTPTVVPCVGDCDGHGSVTVDEILTMVNIALGSTRVDDCLAGDVNGDGQITVDEILAAVNKALRGCGGG